METPILNVLLKNNRDDIERLTNVRFEKLESQVKINEEHLLFVNKRSWENEKMFGCIKGESYFCVPDLGDPDLVVGRSSG